MNHTATPTKLKTGNWGARVTSENISAGDIVTITTRAGKSWQATIERVLWRGKGIAICATASSRGANNNNRRYRDSMDDECELCGGNKWTCGHRIGW